MEQVGRRKRNTKPRCVWKKTKTTKQKRKKREERTLRSRQMTGLNPDLG
jgi:hypothetical protein